MERQSDGQVFHAQQGGVIRENNALKIFKERVLQPLSKRFPTTKGEIGFEHGTFHSFRHYFCSQCFLGGASEGEIRSWLGHAESRMVEHYRHLRNEDAIRKMEQINFLGDSPKSDPASEAG
jgi:integrase